MWYNNGAIKREGRRGAVMKKGDNGVKKRYISAVLLLLFAASLLLALAGCGFPTGDIADYAGTYRVTVSYERVTSVHMKAHEVTSEKDADVPCGVTVIVGDNKKVTLRYSDGSEETGRIRCYKDYAKFSGLPITSSYKFKRSESGGKVTLDYSYTQQKGGFFYDYTSRRIVMEQQD